MMLIQTDKKGIITVFYGSPTYMSEPFNVSAVSVYLSIKL